MQAGAAVRDGDCPGARVRPQKTVAQEGVRVPPGRTSGQRGVWANSSVCSRDLGRSITVGGPSTCLLCVYSFFGRAFEKAAEGTNSRTLHNHFDLSGKSLQHWGPFKVSAGLEPGKLALPEIPCQHPLTLLEPALGLAVSGSSGSSKMRGPCASYLGPDGLPGQRGSRCCP